MRYADQYCHRHYQDTPCEQCRQDADRIHILEQSGAYTYVIDHELPYLMLKVNDKLLEGYTPLGAPVLGIFHSASQGTNNFGRLTTDNREVWWQFLVKEAN